MITYFVRFYTLQNEVLRCPLTVVVLVIEDKMNSSLGIFFRALCELRFTTHKRSRLNGFVLTLESCLNDMLLSTTRNSYDVFLIELF